jgi:hypothetical protein
MSTGETQRTIKRYFDLMGRGADFAECYRADVTWLIADTGQVVYGPDPVRDYINALHATLVDAQTRASSWGRRMPIWRETASPRRQSWAAARTTASPMTSRTN